MIFLICWNMYAYNICENDNMTPIDVKKYNFTMNSKSVIRLIRYILMHILTFSVFTPFGKFFL